jgi:hypothetical protein
MRPCGQPQVLELGKLAEAEAYGDVAAGVVTDGQVGEPVGGGQTAVEGAGAFGGLGGVLGQVRGDLGVGHVAGGGDQADVELAAARQGAGRESRRGGSRDADGAGGLVDGGGEQGDGDPGGRGVGWPGGAVEADDGVEVDDAAALVFGDLGVGDPELRGEGLAGEPGLTGQRPPQGDGEPEAGGSGARERRGDDHQGNGINGEMTGTVRAGGVGKGRALPGGSPTGAASRRLAAVPASLGR